MANLDIAEVVRRSEIPPSALRFYEEKGLIASISRRGQRRLFDPAVLDRLALIALGRQAGFSLEEIARIFAADGRPRIDRRMLTAKAEDLVRTIRNLSAMCDGLRHACLPGVEPHGVSHLPLVPQCCGLGIPGRAQEKDPRTTESDGSGGLIGPWACAQFRKLRAPVHETSDIDIENVGVP